MEAPKTVLLLLIALLVSVSAEDNDFDYKKHGADWPQTCTAPSSNPYIITQANKKSPIILPTITDSQKTSYLFADFKNTKGQAQVLNTTVFINTENLAENWFGEIYTQIMDRTHTSFKAAQIRIRTHSQHRIGDQNGFKDLEVQIYSTPLIGKLNYKLMLAFLFEAQQGYPEDPFLAQIIKGYNNAANRLEENNEFELDVNLNHLLSREQIFNFWFYQGSLTIPPCSQNRINWLIPNKIYKMSVQQRDFFKNLYSPDGNWREVQSTEDREIGYAQVLPVPVQAEL